MSHGPGVKREAGAPRRSRRVKACAAPATVSGSGNPHARASFLKARQSLRFGVGRRGFRSSCAPLAHSGAPRARIPAFATAFGRSGSACPGLPLRACAHRGSPFASPVASFIGREPAGTQAEGEATWVEQHGREVARARLRACPFIGRGCPVFHAFQAFHWGWAWPSGLAFLLRSRLKRPTPARANP